MTQQHPSSLFGLQVPSMSHHGRFPQPPSDCWLKLQLNKLKLAYQNKQTTAFNCIYSSQTEINPQWLSRSWFLRGQKMVVKSISICSLLDSFTVQNHWNREFIPVSAKRTVSPVQILLVIFGYAIFPLLTILDLFICRSTLFTPSMHNYPDNPNRTISSYSQTL